MLPRFFRRYGCAFLLWILSGVFVHAADLGARVAYRPNTPIPYPGFTLTFVAQRRVSSPQFPRGMVVYDFLVQTAEGRQTVAWSAGTGDIGPTLFRVGDERFALELKVSDKLGLLKDGELVVSRVP